MFYYPDIMETCLNFLKLKYGFLYQDILGFYFCNREIYVLKYEMNNYIFAENTLYVLLNIFLPYINSISISIGGTGGVGKGDTNILTDNSTYLPSSDDPIEAIILSKIAATGYNASYNFGSGRIKPTYVYGDSTLNNKIVNNANTNNQDTIYVNLWFKNTNIKNQAPNVLTVPLRAFLAAFPPSIVRAVGVNTITSANANVFWTAPQFTSFDTSTSTGNNDQVISNYKIDYFYIDRDFFLGVRPILRYPTPDFCHTCGNKHNQQLLEIADFQDPQPRQRKHYSYENAAWR
jgi:hypothetical protein